MIYTLLKKERLFSIKSVLLGVVIIFTIVKIICNAYDDLKMYPIVAQPFYVFDTAELSGRIKYIAHKRAKASYFNISTDSNKYYRVTLVRYNAKMNNNFNTAATSGDSVIKHRYSDTLMLLSQGQISYYYIPKPQD